MNIDLNAMWKELKLPLGLTVLFAAVLGLIGISLDQVLAVCASLFGVAALVAVFIDILKWAGVVDINWAGKVSALLNLAVVLGVAFILKFFPAFDFGATDLQIAELAKVLGIVFAYVVQITNTRKIHKATSFGFGFWSYDRG